MRHSKYCTKRSKHDGPAAGDAKAVLKEMHKEGGVHVCIVYDVSKAHRRVPVHECDWGRQSCQIRGSAAAAWKSKRKMRAAEERLEAGRQATVCKLQPNWRADATARRRCCDELGLAPGTRRHRGEEGDLRKCRLRNRTTANHNPLLYHDMMISPRRRKKERRGKEALSHL